MGLWEPGSSLLFPPKINFTERTKSAPFAIVAPFAEQAYDLVKWTAILLFRAYVYRIANYRKARTKPE